MCFYLIVNLAFVSAKRLNFAGLVVTPRYTRCNIVTTIVMDCSYDYRAGYDLVEGCVGPFLENVSDTKRLRRGNEFPLFIERMGFGELA